MFIYVPYRMFNNVQLVLVFHEIILHIHNTHNAIATYAAWRKGIDVWTHNPDIKLFVFVNLNISYKWLKQT